MPERRPLVVGVGASAGGLEAFRRLLAALPTDAGHSYVLVQHLSPDHESHLIDLLQPWTKMTVQTAHDGQRLEPDQVYVIPPDVALTVADGRIQLNSPAETYGVRISVDDLFQSIAREYRDRSVGIILSGAGRDGSDGLRAIKAAGGLTMAQEPDESGQRGMPASAIETGVVDSVRELDGMAEVLERFARMEPPVTSAWEAGDQDRKDEEDGALPEETLARLRSLVKEATGVDLEPYRPHTLSRRVLRRMGLSGHEEVGAYLDDLEQSDEEPERLVGDIFISVTDFFRDPEVFEELGRSVIPEIIEQTDPAGSIRIWVPGCATGEEAYSLGIEFLQALDRRSGPKPGLQIFATDVDRSALERARRGVYGTGIGYRMSKERLDEFFKPLEGRGFQVQPRLRDIVSFAEQDLTRDAPFSRMSLVSCRNVLIYLTEPAQREARNAFHFALNEGGFLVLGTSETPATQTNLFAPHAKSHHIYRRVGTAPARLHLHRGARGREGRGSPPPPPQDASPRGRGSQRETMQGAILEALVPSALVVSEDGDLLFAHGDLDPFLRFPVDSLTRWDLSSVLRPELSARCRAALFRFRSQRTPVSVDVRQEDQSRVVRITARAADRVTEGAVVLSFEERSLPSDEAPAPKPPNGEASIVAQLEKELTRTKEDLRSTVEELESFHEELRSYNEDTTSMNEELQTTNEELEATTEELRSLNEELTTANTQLQEKIEELERSNDDLRNFFASTKIATIFLDAESRLQRFTPAAANLLGVDDGDIGRRVGSIHSALLQEDLEARIKQVLEELGSVTEEIQTSDDRWVSRRVLPYRTGGRQIRGVVVTFDDVSQLRHKNRELKQKSERLELAWETARGGVFEYTVGPHGEPYVSSQWARLLGLRPEEVPGEDFAAWLDERIHPDSLEVHRREYDHFLSGRRPEYATELQLLHASGSWVWLRASYRALRADEFGRVTRVLGMMLDVTDRRQMEDSLRESEERFRDMTDGLPLLVWLHDEEGRQVFVNQTFCGFAGVRREEMTGDRWKMLVHPEDSAAYTHEFEACLQERRPFHAEVRARNVHGEWRWLESWGRPRFDEQGGFLGLVGTSADITERRMMEEMVRANEELLRIAKNASRLGVFDHDLRRNVTRWDRRMEELWGLDASDPQPGLTALLSGVHPEDRRLVSDAIEAAVDGAPMVDLQYRVIHQEHQSVRWIQTNSSTRFDEGKAVRLVGTVRDVSAQRELQERLLQADRQKNEFLAMLGHELRNPLSGLRTATEILKLQDPAPAAQNVYAVLDRQTSHMSKLLDGLLDFSRIALGKLSLEREAQDLVEICRSVAWDAEARTEQKSQRLELDLPDEPIILHCDRVRMVQIVDNLLSNALKYTPQGGHIWLRASVQGQEAVVEVSDDGLGIDPELLPDIFDEFCQAEQGLVRSEGGLGLGLSLVRKLVELHGGRVEAMSEGRDRGSSFFVYLPLGQAPVPAAPAQQAVKTLSRLRILLIEDNVDSAEMFRELLTMLGHEVDVEHQGQAGIDTATSSRPDLVLCDVGLPEGMSGYDVARALRARPETSDAVAIAVTGYGRYEDQRQAQDAGFDAHLTKPLDVAQLKAVLSRFFG